MAPANAPETLRKALAMGATRGVHVTDPALAGSCAVSTATVLAAALGTLEFDLVFAGVDSSDGVGGVVPAGDRRASRPAVPVLRRPDRARHGGPAPSASDASRATGYDVLEAPMPAVIGGTQALGEPRYPSLKGIMAARTKEIVTLSLADLGLDGSTVGGAVATTDGPRQPRLPPARAATEIVRGTPDEGAARIVEFLAERRII